MQIPCVPIATPSLPIPAANPPGLVVQIGIPVSDTVTLLPFTASPNPFVTVAVLPLAAMAIVVWPLLPVARA